MENIFFDSCLEIMFTYAVGTISNSDGATWIMDEEEDGPNLVAEASWNLPDLETTDD